MSGKSINFDNKNIQKSDFYKNKKLFKIEDTDINKVYFSLKNNHMAQKMRLNILLYTLIMMKLNQYV